MQEVKNCINILTSQFDSTCNYSQDLYNNSISLSDIYFYYYVSSWNLISNLISPYNITTESQINARRTKEMITNQRNP